VIQYSGFMALVQRIFSAALILATAAAAPPLHSQTKDKDVAHDVLVSAITIAVTVQNRGGRYVDDLEQPDFKVFENGRERTVTYFRNAFEAPVSLTVLLDVSGSMAIQDKLAESRTALTGLVERLLGPPDETALLLFADGQVEVAAPLSNDRAAFLDALRSAEAYGQTALNDAVAVSPEFAGRSGREKRALLLITDGIENGSEATPDQALEIARRVDVPIYVIGYKIPRSDLNRYKRAANLTAAGIVEVLERFSAATGGKAFFPDTADALAAAVGEIRRELSHQYIIGYTSYQDPEGGYRRIEVKTTNKRHTIRTRQGY
jgi:Ca-activated chloride channel homolog